MILGVSIISCFAVYSSSHEELIRFYQHVRNILIAGLLIIFLSHVPSVIIEKFAIPAYVTTILLLIATEFFGETVLVDEFSANYLQGAIVDYHDDLNGAGFKIKNPNAKQSCGCGNSFET